MNIPPAKGSPAYTNELYRRQAMLQKALREVQQEIDQINSQVGSWTSKDNPYTDRIYER